MAVLLAVMDAGSLSAAGRKLGMPLATVSRKISALETLLTRSTRRLSLTDAGRTYVDACRRIMDDIDEAERCAGGEYSEPRGELIVAAPFVLGRLHVLPTLTEFLRAYPEVNVRLALGDRIVNLIEDHIDLALRVGALPDSTLKATQLGSIRRVTCASPAYLTAHGRPGDPRELAAHQCVSFEFIAAANTWQFQREGHPIAVPIAPRLTASTAEAAIDAAMLGAGITNVFSYQVEAALRAGTLELLLRAFEPAPLPVTFLYSAHGRLPLKLRSLIDFAAPRLRARLQGANDALTLPVAPKHTQGMKKNSSPR
jgi:DNA-binding transcriptional LysR family regulator